MLLSKLRNLFSRRRKSASRIRPSLEALESRIVPSDGFAPHPIDINRDAIIYTPLNSEGLVFHIHPQLTIVINGQDQVIPAGIGIFGLPSPGIMQLHTHDASGTIHVESIVTGFQYQLRDFFTIWGQTFNSTEILGHHADAAHPITMTVDGKPSTAFGSLPLVTHDGALQANPGDPDNEQIVITLDGVA